MAYKILVFAMLVTLHSTILMFGSFLSNKWLIDGNKDIGIYGICDHLNKTFIKQMLNNQIESDIAYSALKAKNQTTINASGQNKNELILRSNLFITSSLPSIVSNSQKQLIENAKSYQTNQIMLISDELSFQKCYQLLWPTNKDAFEYISSKQDIFFLIFFFKF